MLKKLLFLTITFLLISPTVVAQWQWSIRGGAVNTMLRTTDYNNITDIETDASGNVYILAKTGGAGLKVANQSLTAYSSYGTYNSIDIVLSSFKADGTYRWSKVIGGHLYDFAYGLNVDQQGHVYVMGRIDNPTETMVGVPYTPVHFDTDTTLTKVPIAPGGLVYKDSLQQSLFLVQYDTAGIFSWLSMPEPDTTTKNYGNFPFRMDVDNSGNVHWWCYLKPGEFRWANNNIITQEGMYVLKYNPQGQVLSRAPLDMSVGDLQFWGLYGSAEFKVDATTGNYHIAGTNDGGTSLIIGGDTIKDRMYLAAFDSNGQLIWKKEGSNDPTTTPLMGNNAIHTLELDDNGDIYVGGTAYRGSQFAGYTVDYPRVNTGHAAFLIRLNSSGNLIWGINPQPESESPAWGVAVADTEVAICGEFPDKMYWPNGGDTIAAEPNQGYDAFLTRFNKSNGELITMERTETPFGGASYGNAIAAGPQNTYYLGGNFSMSMFLGQDTLYKVGSQRSFFLTKYECDVPEASMSVRGINASNTINLVYTGAPADSVKWYLGDGTQVWGDSITYSYAAKGKYRVCAMAYFECTEVTVCDSLVAGEISLTEESLAEVAIYPNPTNGVLNLENLPKHSSVKLYNLNGKLLLQKQFKDMKASLDLSQFSKGVYLLELQNGAGERAFRKVMKE
ncbi:T9SS type A sorting domain-containing protein [Owenweeksia hongkongensis]|uniref:T9SS type A sorting domain-containing protein n=1 Tax=Owenweeksia hongkongensis TaxID=253245 RepID=UPI003A8EA6ED